MPLTDALDLSNYTLNGTAELVDSQISLTTATGNEAGSAILGTYELDSIDGLSVTFEMYSQPNGADGWAVFVIDAAQDGPTSVGQNGGGRGVNGMAAIGFCVEEFGGGASSCFISQTNGSETSYGEVDESNAAVTGDHTYTVSWKSDGSGNYTMSVVRDGEALITDQAIGTFDATQFWLGFSGGTGGASAAHTLLNVTAIYQGPPIITPTLWVDDRFYGTVNVTADGFIDDVFGTPSLSGGTPVIVPTLITDDVFGVTQIISGDLTQYYGPLPTPLIADAPYSQVYAGDEIENPTIEAPKVAPDDSDGASDTSSSSDQAPPNQGNSRYKFVITDMLGNVQGEVLQASQKTIAQVLDSMSIASFTIKTSNPMADYILNNDCLCKCYRQPVNRNFAYRLMLTGDVCTDEEDASGDTSTITFTVVDPLNRLTYRLIGKNTTSANHGAGFTVGTAASPNDIADIIGAMLAEINTDADLGHTGVTLGIRGPNTPTSYVDTVYFTQFTTQLALYTNVVDGVDFYIEPQEPWSLAAYPPQPGTNPYLTGGPPSDLPPEKIVTGKSVKDTCIGMMNIYAPMGNYEQIEGPPAQFSKGRPYAVFEYGTGKRNMQGYQRIRDRSQVTNLWWNLPDGYPDANSSADPIVKSKFTVITPEGTAQTSVTARGGYESVDTSDLGTGAQSLRQQLVDSDVATTAAPREQITFTPTINCDEDWTIDYFLGDVCTVRAFVPEANNGAGSWRFNGTVRIYGISTTMDDNEQEQITITTTPPSASGISAPSDDVD